ncbi:heat-inducible transcriptional repressor HrcA [Mycoplasmopsis felis]|uniref:heat-inducible transcriptional repressor HrcA n=1 Tax=Mycoplasmopsis felis TaxID=33923 RepID=UPI002AFDFB03|nr:heat-inducible transcriptional repressor HrcA [Mycoplasmopsis felis]WQQ07182.1 heat-inducible transcriptional repressor HrcA [Mycoplasmopsis felis]
MKRELLKVDEEKVLKYTVLIYTQKGESVSSETLIKNYPEEINFSSAKVRYIMTNLEKKDFLTKPHFSSGRIPTPKGLNYYANYLSITYEQKFLTQLNAKLSRKNDDIDLTVEQAVKVITEMTDFTIVTKSSVKLKNIQLVPLDETKVTVVLVVSTGDVYSKIMNISQGIKLQDLRIAIRIFNERLLDIDLEQIPKFIYTLAEVLAQEVKNYQDVINSFISQVFNEKLKIYMQNKVYGKNNLILKEEIDRKSLSEMLNLIENFSVWEKLEETADEQQNLKISIDSSRTYMSKKIESKSNTTEISILSTSATDYDKMKTALNVLEMILKKGKK